jgi:SAM-dependent methyltransferase
MGINFGSAELLRLENLSLPFSGSILQLGKQHFSFPADNRGFFGRLGFSEVKSLDRSDFEGADFIADLNLPLPVELHDRFDVVLNGGTLEHIFHVPNVLSNVHRLLKVGGRVIHIAPASNQIDHGFYCFSPTLFHDYYTANRYEIRALHLCEFDVWQSPWRVYSWSPGILSGQKFYRNSVFGVFCVARKLPDSTDSEIPVQSYYANWKAPATNGHDLLRTLGHRLWPRGMEVAGQIKRTLLHRPPPLPLQNGR